MDSKTPEISFTASCRHIYWVKEFLKVAHSSLNNIPSQGQSFLHLLSRAGTWYHLHPEALISLSEHLWSHLKVFSLVSPNSPKGNFCFCKCFCCSPLGSPIYLNWMRRVHLEHYLEGLLPFDSFPYHCYAPVHAGVTAMTSTDSYPSSSCICKWGFERGPFRLNVPTLTHYAGHLGGGS